MKAHARFLRLPVVPWTPFLIAGAVNAGLFQGRLR